MNILSLDIATSTGWAVWRNGAVFSGTQSFATRRGESPGPGLRYLRFTKWLDDMLREYDIDLVVYEIPNQRGGAATEFLLGMVGHMKSCIEKANQYRRDHGLTTTKPDILFQGVAISTLKKFATGEKGANKDAMVAAARERWPDQAVAAAEAAEAAAWAEMCAAIREIMPNAPGERSPEGR